MFQDEEHDGAQSMLSRRTSRYSINKIKTTTADNIPGSSHNGTPGQTQSQPQALDVPTPRTPTDARKRSPTPAGRTARPQSQVLQEQQAQQQDQGSPLARLFSRRGAPMKPLDIAPNLQPQVPAAGVEEAIAGVKRVESLLENMRDTPVQKLRADIKELQVRNLVRSRLYSTGSQLSQERQMRIESLLMTLTRTARGDTIASKPLKSP